jgi:spore coat protein CotH
MCLTAMSRVGCVSKLCCYARGNVSGDGQGVFVLVLMIDE